MSARPVSCLILHPFSNISPLGHGHGLQYIILTRNSYKNLLYQIESRVSCQESFFTMNLVASIQSYIIIRIDGPAFGIRESSHFLSG
jgi:hypothetical protein